LLRRPLMLRVPPTLDKVPALTGLRSGTGTVMVVCSVRFCKMRWLPRQRTERVANLFDQAVNPKAFHGTGNLAAVSVIQSPAQIFVLKTADVNSPLALG
jgi:hypothetical protein